LTTDELRKIANENLIAASRTSNALGAQAFSLIAIAAEMALVRKRSGDSS
jgi:hypothetical protein